MMNRSSLTLVAVGFLLPLWASAWVAAAGTPSKDDIIDALISKDASPTSRGFTQMPATAAAKPRPSSTTASYRTEAPSQAAPPAAHASIGVPILFDVNSATIRPESRETLSNIAAALQSPSLKDSRILLEGHTDGRGSPDVNLELSQQRANAVRDFLIAEGGVPGDRLSTIGKGQSEPANPADPLGPENRRVVLVNLNN